MGNVIVELTMSLDGFIAGANDGSEQPLGDGGEQLFTWYFNGDTEVTLPNSEMVFKTDPVSAELIRESFYTYGASVTGRRTFDIANAWGGKDPYGVPSFIVSHSVPAEWSGADSPFTFVTDGVASAIAQAQAAAGHKDVGVAAASIAQQCLKLGLLDEIRIHLAPILLGQGIRLFDHFGAAPVELEATRVVAAPGVTHLTFRVVK
jgi:dihydrofolate reductase